MFFEIFVTKKVFLIKSDTEKYLNKLIRFVINLKGLLVDALASRGDERGVRLP